MAFGYEENLGIINDLLEGYDVEAEDEGEALNKAEEAMSFVLSLHNAFAQQGVTMPDEPDVGLLENLFDAYVCELAAATMALQNYAGSPERLRTVAKELMVEIEAGRVKVDPQTVQGYLKLADRIEASREAFKPLMKQYEADNPEKA